MLGSDRKRTSNIIGLSPPTMCRRFSLLPVQSRLDERHAGSGSHDRKAERHWQRVDLHQAPLQNVLQAMFAATAPFLAQPPRTCWQGNASSPALVGRLDAEMSAESDHSPGSRSIQRLYPRQGVGSLEVRKLENASVMCLLRGLEGLVGRLKMAASAPCRGRSMMKKTDHWHEIRSLRSRIENVDWSLSGMK